MITLLALGAAALLARPILRRTRAKGTGELSQWMDGIALLGLALAAVAIFYQGLPALTA